MAPKELLHDTVEYNRRLNLSQKMLKSKKRPLPVLPLGLVGPLQPYVSASVPAESGKVVSRHLWARDVELQEIPCNQECQSVSQLNPTK